MFLVYYCYNVRKMDKQTVVSRLKELELTYRPSPEVLRQLSHINLLAVVGPSGAGKSTLTRQAGIPFVIGDTTRAPRPGEVHGRDYNFRNDPEALLDEIERGEFVQFVVERETEVYGTKATSYPSTGVCAMSIISTSLPRFRELGFASVIPVYIVPPNHSEWMRRIAAHKDRDLEARLLEAKQSLEAALNDPQYVFIVNDDLQTAIATMRAVADGQFDHNDSARARNSARALQEQLEKTIR